MTMLKLARQMTVAAALAAGIAAPAFVAPALAQTSEVRYIVDNQPVTSYDIQRRAAFLRLQQRGGGQQAAAEEMIEQALRNAEVRRLGINVSDDQVRDAFGRFAASNNMSTQQLEQVLGQQGVTSAHFRDYIRAQMGWGQALQRRARDGRSSETDIVQRMLQDGGNQPSATEYMLQQVIFVVPAAERGARLAARKREAEALRARFAGCESTREFARGLLDVTVRDLGRVLDPELPPDWAPSIRNIRAGQATVVRETDRGAEFIGICSAREVSDDRVAQLLFDGGGSDESQDELSRQYTQELRERAQIVNR